MHQHWNLQIQTCTNTFSSCPIKYTIIIRLMTAMLKFVMVQLGETWQHAWGI